MRHVSIALAKAIALSTWIFLNSGFLAMAADPTSVPANNLQNSSEAPDQPTISSDENSEIDQKIAERKEAAETTRQISLEQAGPLSTDEQIPIGVSVNGIPREEGLTIYLPSETTTDTALLPLSTMSEILSYGITVNAGDKKAEGFFEKEENTFLLDLNTNEISIAGKKRPLEEGEALVQDGDIFIRLDAFKEWFGIDVTFDIANLELVINSGSDLPFQERLKRLLNAKRNEKTYTFDAIKPENAAMAPYKNFSLPSLYLTSTTGFESRPDGKNVLGLATLQGYQDIAKFETDYTLSGQYLGEEGSAISNARLTMSRRDPLKRLLGPLKAGRISFGDVNYPSVPLFGGTGGTGAGVEINSDSALGVRYTSEADDFILEGDAPIGYDAELYRNGIFVAFQQIPADGRYRFENIELPAGFNSFEIILYGPLGQKTIIKRDVTRGARQLAKGETQYHFAAGTPKGDLLPFAEDARDARNAGASGQIFHGFTNFFTMGLSAFNGPQSKPRALGDDPFTITDRTSRDDEYVNSTGGAVSSAVSFLGINLQGQVMGADRGRSAYDTSANTRILGANVGISHTTYKNFLEEDQELTKRSELFLSKNFNGFNTTFRVQKTDFLERDSETSVENIISFSFAGLSINNDLIRTYSQDENYDDFEGELTALATVADIRIRGSLLYDLDPEATERLRRIGFSAQKSLTARSSLRFEGNHEFETDVDNLGIRYSRDYEKFGLDLDANASSDQNYTFTVGFRAALQPDTNNRYHLVDPVSGGLAAVGVRAFVDNNKNDIFDAGDEPLSGLEFRASTGDAREATNKDGITYLTNLGETPLRLKIVSETIPDIYLAPKFDHRDLIPRRGSTPVIDFPFVRMGEIAGYLTHLKEGVEGVIVKLLSIADGSVVEETETDSDGYFIFPAVKGGNYKVSFGTKEKSDFLSLNVALDTSIEYPEEYKVEASDELAQAAKDAATIKPAAQNNIDRMNGPAGEMPNIDDPLDEEDLKPLDEKGVEGIITQ